MGVSIRGFDILDPFKELGQHGNRHIYYTIRELTMLAWINELSDAPEWDRKTFDPDFIFQWRSEKIGAGGTRSMVDWVSYDHHIPLASLIECLFVVWPNVFQTRLQSFKLDDPSKTGYLRMVTLHLIDPNRRMMGTAVVPCQRRDWWAQDIRSRCPRFWRLTREVSELIVEHVNDYHIYVAEGERTRDEFRAEREGFRERYTKAFLDLAQWGFLWRAWF